MDPKRRRLGELTFRECMDRFQRLHPGTQDVGKLLANAAYSQTLVELAGGSDPEGDLPVSRWVAEAGPSARALARQTLTEWAATGVPYKGATSDEIATWREVCQKALTVIAEPPGDE